MNIGFRENMTVEFKSDLKKLSDDVIIESVVAFANTDGGKFFLGVEDNGDIRLSRLTRILLSWQHLLPIRRFHLLQFKRNLWMQMM